jgi:hypothetical protein
MSASHPLQTSTAIVLCCPMPKPMKPVSVILLISACLFVAPRASAAEYKNPDLKFAITLPDGWAVKGPVDVGPTSSRHYKGVVLDGPVNQTASGVELGGSVEVLPASTQLSDEDHFGLIGTSDYEDWRIAKDSLVTHEGFQAREMEGPASEDGDPGHFYALAIKPSRDAALILLVVEGDDKTLENATLRSQIHQLLASFRPL